MSINSRSDAYHMEDYEVGFDAGLEQGFTDGLAQGRQLEHSDKCNACYDREHYISVLTKKITSAKQAIENLIQKGSIPAEELTTVLNILTGVVTEKVEKAV